MAVITFDGVKKTFGSSDTGFVALEQIDLVIADKEFIAIVGPSGCGKTTCLRLVAGFEAPTAGTVSVDGRKVTGPGPDRAVVFQQFALFPWKTVSENIALGLRNKGVEKIEREKRIRQAVELMGLKGYEEAFPHQLSGGMQQRVAIARSYAVDSQVLLMDEPFAALDTQTRQLMQEALLDLVRREPKTVLFVTHSVEEALYLANRVIVLGRRPASVKASIDISEIRTNERWNDQLSTALLSNAKFNEIRASVWSILREEILAERQRHQKH